VVWQDRVVQVYEGLVFMDLSTELLQQRNYGDYTNLFPAGLEILPQFFLAYHLRVM
jgi:glucuronokinase